MKNEEKRVLTGTLLVLVFLIIILLALLLQKGKDTETGEEPDVSYYPEISGGVIEKIPENPESEKEEVPKEEGNGSKLALTYTKKLEADAEDGKAVLMLQNPSKSTHAITLSVQMTDEELLEKIGKTGRSEEEQQELEERTEYDPAASRVTLAVSDRIQPGEMITAIGLSPLSDGTWLPAGVYEAVYWIELYDPEGGSKAALNTQIPVQLTIH